MNLLLPIYFLAGSWLFLCFKGSLSNMVQWICFSTTSQLGRHLGPFHSIASLTSWPTNFDRISKHILSIIHVVPRSLCLLTKIQKLATPSKYLKMLNKQAYLQQCNMTAYSHSQWPIDPWRAMGGCTPPGIPTQLSPKPLTLLGSETETFVNIRLQELLTSLWF